MPTFQQRMQLALPPWWGSAHPILDQVVNGYAAGHAAIFQQLTALAPLMRLNTVTGDLLDIAAYDLLGSDIARVPTDNDDSFRARLKAALFQIYGVRSAFIPQVSAIANSPATVIDPRKPSDTGVCGNVALNKVPTLFYNSKRTNNCYTNLKMSYQWFVQVANKSNYTDAQLRVQIQALMPAGTVAYVKIKAN